MRKQSEENIQNENTASLPWMESKLGKEIASLLWPTGRRAREGEGGGGVKEEMQEKGAKDRVQGREVNRYLRSELKSSTRMISWTRLAGVRFRTLQESKMEKNDSHHHCDNLLKASIKAFAFSVCKPDKTYYWLLHINWGILRGNDITGWYWPPSSPLHCLLHLYLLGTRRPIEGQLW